jgi:hypothetical protein
LTWDKDFHGAGKDRGNGPQDGHWDDENSDNRWDRDGNPLPGSKDHYVIDPQLAGGTVVIGTVGGVVYIIIRTALRVTVPVTNFVPIP